MLKGQDLIKAIEEYLDHKQSIFPPRHINNPPHPIDRLLCGVCVFCGGSLGKPYQEDLFHGECYSEVA